MKNSLKSASATVLALTLVGLVGCSSSSNDGNNNGDGSGGDQKISFDATDLINNLADSIISQSYANLNLAAADLVAATDALVADGATEPEMQTARQAWIDARVPWESSEGFLFGPVDSLGIDPALDSWPLNTPDLQAVLSNSSAANDYLAFVQSATEDLQGFHAIEFLLFGDGVADNDKTAAELTANEALYLQALTQVFKTKAQQLEDGWLVDFGGNGPYATLLKTPGASNTAYTSQGAVIEELINGVVAIADEVGNAKIAEPFAASAETADTTLVESQYSWNSLTDFYNNVQSILNVYSGSLGYNSATDSISDTMNGMYSFVLAHDPTLANQVLAEIIDVQEKIALIKGDSDATTPVISGSAAPFRVQIGVADQRQLIEDAITALATLQSSLETTVFALIAKTTFAQ